MLYATLGMGPFPDHGNRIPRISDGRFNPARDSGDIGIDTFQQQVLQAHGILMLIAWPLLAFTAIFFAAWMKQALPNGEWFLVRPTPTNTPTTHPHPLSAVCNVYLICPSICTVPQNISHSSSCCSCGRVCLGICSQ